MSYLIHFNPNHDPKNGRFTFSKTAAKVAGIAAGNYSDKELSDKEAKEIASKYKNYKYLYDENGKHGLPGVLRTLSKGDIQMSYIMHFNPNHDKLGRFTFSKGGSVSEKKSPDSYRTSELDSKYRAYKDAKVSEFYERIMKLPWVESDDDNTEEVWGEDVVKIADIGLEGLGWLNPGDIDDNSERSWFLFEDQTIGMPEIAYLASQGKSVKEIVDMINSVNDCEHQNNEFLEQYREEFHKNRNVYDEAKKKLPYPDAYYCGFTEYGRTDEKDEFINGCVEAAKKMEHSDMSDYLQHFNPRHDPKTGRFDFAPGSSNEKGNANKYEKEYKKLLESYRWMSINDKMLTKSYELGKANFEPVWKKLADMYMFGGLVPGTAKALADFRDTGKNKWTGADKMGKIFKDARAETTKQMKMDYVTLHPDEAVEQYMLVSKLEDVLYGKE